MAQWLLYCPNLIFLWLLHSSSPSLLLWDVEWLCITRTRGNKTGRYSQTPCVKLLSITKCRKADLNHIVFSNRDFRQIKLHHMIMLEIYISCNSLWTNHFGLMQKLPFNQMDFYSVKTTGWLNVQLRIEVTFLLSWSRFAGTATVPPRCFAVHDLPSLQQKKHFPKSVFSRRQTCILACVSERSPCFRNSENGLKSLLFNRNRAKMFLQGWQVLLRIARFSGTLSARNFFESGQIWLRSVPKNT